ncbi:hypothetical protein MEX01_24340 [Methylorubrum extorquens]|nr:hypothetical protein MEX01_24340 [Methylorubrum extorquens]
MDKITVITAHERRRLAFPVTNRGRAGRPAARGPGHGAGSGRRRHDRPAVNRSAPAARRGRCPRPAIAKEAPNAAGIDLPYPTSQVLFHDQAEETYGNRSRLCEGWPAGRNPPLGRWQVTWQRRGVDGDERA